MKLFYFNPAKGGRGDGQWDLVAEHLSQKRPNTPLFDLVELQQHVRQQLATGSKEQIVIVLAGHGREEDGAVESDVEHIEGEDMLTAEAFFNGVQPPDQWPGGPREPWEGLKKLVEGRSNKAAPIYVLAAQCYGRKFTALMPPITDANTTVLGLSDGKIYPDADEERLTAYVWEVEEELQRIAQQEGSTAQQEGSTAQQEI